MLVAMHLFAGARRERDVQHFVEQKAGEKGLEVLILSADLDADAAWDLARPDTLDTLMSL